MKVFLKIVAETDKEPVKFFVTALWSFINFFVQTSCKAIYIEIVSVSLYMELQLYAEPCLSLTDITGECL
jgi:hypothetical protein